MTKKFLISRHLWKLAHIVFLFFLPDCILPFFLTSLFLTFFVGFLCWYEILELSCITSLWQAWRSLFENNLIIDHWEGLYGCVAVSDKTSKKGITGRKAASGRVWPSRVLSGFLSFPWVTARQAGLHVGRTTWLWDVARCCILQGLTHTVICFVMLGDSTIVSVSNTCSCRPRADSKLWEWFVFVFFCFHICISKDNIFFNRFASFYWLKPTVNHCFSTNFTLREL